MIHISYMIKIINYYFDWHKKTMENLAEIICLYIGVYIRVTKLTC
jgi:hypothetical protein